MLNMGASIRYTLPVKLPCTLFVKGDNLFDRKYDRYWGYRQMGVNVLGGLALSF
jgi:outer membrane receptor protein involved in Fe transport